MKTHHLAIASFILMGSIVAKGDPVTPETDREALCRSVDKGTACEAIDQGIRDPRTGRIWKRADQDVRGVERASACERLGSGYRLPSLAEVEDAFERDLFGYCSMTVWSSTPAAGEQSAWIMGVAYEGSPRCQEDEHGRTCVGGCGPYRFEKREAELGDSFAIVCVKDP